MVNNFNIQRNFNLGGNSFNSQSSFRNTYSNHTNTHYIEKPINNEFNNKTNIQGIVNEHAFHQNRYEEEKKYKSADGKTWASQNDALAANKKYFQELIDNSKK